MSVKAMTWAWSVEGLNNPSEVVVLMALADAANSETNLTWLAIPTIASKARMTPRNVQRVLQRLTDAGFVRTSSRFHASGRQQSNVYELAVDGPFPSIDTGEGDKLSPYETSHFDEGDKLSPTPAKPAQTGGGGRQIVTGEGDASVAPITLNPKKEPPNQTKPRPTPSHADVAPGSVRFGSGLEPHEWDLIDRALPPGMAALDPSGARLVLGQIQQLLKLGWRPHEVRETLNGNPLPDQIGSLPALVGYRLEQLQEAPAPRQRRQQDLPLPEDPLAPPAAPVASLGLRDLALERFGHERIRPRTWWIETFSDLQQIPTAPKELEKLLAAGLRKAS